MLTCFIVAILLTPALSACSSHQYTSCGECADDTQLFNSCRWCAKTRDCNAVGSVFGHCSSEERVTDSTQCPDRSAAVASEVETCKLALSVAGQNTLCSVPNIITACCDAFNAGFFCGLQHNFTTDNAGWHQCLNVNIGTESNLANLQLGACARMTAFGQAVKNKGWLNSGYCSSSWVLDLAEEEHAGHTNVTTDDVILLAGELAELARPNSEGEMQAPVLVASLCALVVAVGFVAVRRRKRASPEDFVQLEA